MRVDELHDEVGEEVGRARGSISPARRAQLSQQKGRGRMLGRTPGRSHLSPTSTQSSSCVPCGRSRRCGWTAEMVPAGSSTATVPGAPPGAEAEKTRDEVK